MAVKGTGSRWPQRGQGFTLIEVMVALAIVALTVPALLLVLDQQIDGTAHLRDRALAQIVATNRLSELRLSLRRGQGALQGTLSGSEEMADREWFWRAQSTATRMDGFSRLEIQVRVDEGEDVTPLYTLVAYLAINAQG